MSSTLSTVAYVRLQEDLRTGRFLPGGKLQLEALSERYGIDRAPLRESLQRLCAEGRVEQKDQRGFFVPPISREELLEVTRTRHAIHALALAESLRDGDAEWEERVLISFHRLSRTPLRLPDGMKNPDRDAAHRLFHRRVLEGGTMPLIVDFAEALFDRGNRYRHLSAEAASVRLEQRDSQAEHRRLMEAVLARDIAGATAMLYDHVQATADIVLKLGESVWGTAAETASAPSGGDSGRKRRKGT